MTIKPTLHYSRSSGPGGQHVNKSHTRVELRLDLTQAGLTAAVYSRLTKLAGHRVDKHGVLHLFSQASRSQTYNRVQVFAELDRLLDQARVEPTRRLPTHTPQHALAAGKDLKIHRSRKKQQRRQPCLQT